MSCENCYHDTDLSIVDDADGEHRWICAACEADAQPLHYPGHRPGVVCGYEFPDVMRGEPWWGKRPGPLRPWYRPAFSARADILLPRLRG